jgi:hypothetical protein
LLREGRGGLPTLLKSASCSARRIRGNAFRHHCVSICHRAGFSSTIAQEASPSDGIIGLVAANTGVSIYPECIRNIQRSGLCIWPLADKDTAIDTVAR